MFKFSVCEFKTDSYLCRIFYVNLTLTTKNKNLTANTEMKIRKESIHNKEGHQTTVFCNSGRYRDDLQKQPQKGGTIVTIFDILI